MKATLVVGEEEDTRWEATGSRGIKPIPSKEGTPTNSRKIGVGDRDSPGMDREGRGNLYSADRARGQ